eukprot:jgi/Mesvir1/7914/Mv26581-RA.4
MERHRVVFVLVDGIGDVAIPSLGFRTPLQATELPFFDAIAAAGLNGLMDPVEPGLACGSDTAHMSILGYDPRIYYRGRGAFESMGAGLPMSPGDIAFKSNFAFVNDGTGIVEKRRADRQFEEYGPALCQALDSCTLPSFPGYQVSVRYATEHRCGVVVRGPGLSGNISGTDPLKDNLPLLNAEPLDELATSRFTATLVNELSDVFRAILRGHPLNAQRAAEGRLPANVVLLRGCGIRIEVPTFSQQHGFRGCMVAPTKIIAGLGMSLEMEVVPAQGATGDYGTSLSSKARAIVGAITAGGRTTSSPATCTSTASDKSSDTSNPSKPAAVTHPTTAPPSAATIGGTAAAVGIRSDRDLSKAAAAAVGHPGPVDGATTGAHLQDSLPLSAVRQMGGGAQTAPFNFGFLHIKAVDDAGHDRNLALKRAGLRSVDAMLGQLVRALWQAEGRGDGRYILCVTGDHTTPVEYGDHSCEPVPFAAAYLRDIVDLLGPDHVLSINMDDIPTPQVAAASAGAIAASHHHVTHGEAGHEASDATKRDAVASSHGAGGSTSGVELARGSHNTHLFEPAHACCQGDVPAALANLRLSESLAAAGASIGGRREGAAADAAALTCTRGRGSQCDCKNQGGCKGQCGCSDGEGKGGCAAWPVGENGCPGGQLAGVVIGGVASGGCMGSRLHHHGDGVCCFDEISASRGEWWTSDV